MKELLLPSGGSVALLETNGEHVTLLAPGAAPPGSSLSVTFEGTSLTIKVRGSRRVEPDAQGRAFRVEGRFVSLPRAVRLSLLG